MPESTELRWTYAPADFPIGESRALNTGILSGSDGRLTLAMQKTNPVPAEVRERACHEVNAVISALMLVHERPCTVSAQPAIYQHDGVGGSSVAISASDEVALTVRGFVPECIVLINEKVVRDTAAERKAADESFLSEIIPRIAKAPLLQELCAMYRRALSDPANEIARLYDIRDRVAKHFVGAHQAQNVLKVSKDEWDTLGNLANCTPIDNGRHPGRFPERRKATAEELNTARAAARELIRRVAGTFPTEPESGAKPSAS